MKTAIATAVAMVAFAANSLLCRLALGGELIDAGTFAIVRVSAGVVVLVVLVYLPGRRSNRRLELGWQPALALTGYLVLFSFAYLSLAAGTGALILFGAVQLTMALAAWREGERFNRASWAGLALAVAGLVYLVAPGVSAPSPEGAALMTLAGVAWGIYSLSGRKARDALGATAGNFLLALPLTLIACLPVYAVTSWHISADGLALAAASGALASALGYAVWFFALRSLAASRAAVVQLTVPVIAALGGVLILSEDVSLRLVLSSVATLGGIWIVLSQRVRA